MQIIVPMAGNGSRFQNTEFYPYKPLIQVKNKTILEWTLSSIPSLKDSKINFVIRKDHDELYHVSEHLLFNYKANIITLDKPTRGGLETCLIACNRINVDPEEPLLLLDSDNYYDGSKFEEFIGQFSGDFCSIIYFDAPDDNPKWCYAIPEDYRIVKLSEKDPDALQSGGMPMVGVFYYSKAKIFINEANNIIRNNYIIKNEYYLSQSLVSLIDKNIPIYGMYTSKVIPLGTPEDVREFLKN